tara:strand:- start:353 stop:991 length:639 start_codon:yes stop_codon:yes gene_type:complete
MIDLNNKKPFAEGGNRRCFVHPEKENRCLKITFNDRSKILKKNAPWYKKLRSEDSFDDNLREKKGYSQRALKMDDPYKWKHLAIWYGMVETSLGRASETELIRDSKNNIAITLEKYLLINGMTTEIKKAISDLESWLRSTLILTKDILPHNIVVSDKDNHLTLKIVDGLGSKSFLPFARIHDFFAKRYIDRRIEQMWSRIHLDLSGRKGRLK